MGLLLYKSCTGNYGSYQFKLAVVVSSLEDIISNKSFSYFSSLISQPLVVVDLA